MTNWQKNLRHWRALSPDYQTQVTWRRIPRQVAQSMAFEGQPVDFNWLERLHAQTPPPKRSSTAVGGLHFPLR
jgi:hypothetical protein